MAQEREIHLLCNISLGWNCKLTLVFLLCNNQAAPLAHVATDVDLLQHSRLKSECGQGSLGAEGVVQRTPQARPCAEARPRPS